MVYEKDTQFVKFCAYGFFKNLRFFDPFLLLFFVEKGMAYAQIGLLYAVREIVINILEVPSGMVADVIGRKRAMLLSFSAYITSFILFYVLTGFWGFVFAFVCYGIGDAFRTGTHKAMILSYLKRKGWEGQKTLYYGHTRSWSQRGSALAALLSAVLVFYTGSYKYVFLLSVIPYMIDFILMASYPSFLNGEMQSTDLSAMQLFKTHFAELKEAFSHRRSFKIIMTTSAYTGYYKALKDYMQPILVALALTLPFFSHMGTKQKSALVIGIIYSLLFLLSAQVSKSGHRIERRFGHVAPALLWVQLIGWGGGVLAGLACYAGQPVLAVLCFAVVLLVQNARRPMAIRYVSDAFGDKIMATVLSAESQSETLFTAVFALVMGVMVDWFGMGMALVGLSLFLVLSQLALRYWKRRT